MRMELIRGSKGNLMLLIRFNEAPNFRMSELSWIPTLDEVRDIAEALKLLNK